MKKTIIIGSQNLGNGNDELGILLMKNFLRKLWSETNMIEQIIFYNSGVKLLSKELNSLDSLTGLFNAGVDIIACGTCIEFYNLQDEIKVGRISGMQEIVNIMLNSKNVITV